MTHSPTNPSLHRLALLLAAATFPLIFVGGLVTSHQAGMSVPDWPNSYGYNMFLFPPNQWVGGILYEHTHRLMGTVVGFLAIMLAAAAYGPSRKAGARCAFGWIAAGTAALAIATLSLLLLKHAAGHQSFTLRSNAMHGVVGLASVAAICAVLWRARTREPRRWVRRLSLVALGAVIFQGALGGLRVVLIDLDLAVVHGCFAQAFFCLTAVTALVTSRWWADAPDLSATEDSLAGRRLAFVAVAAVVVVFGQLFLGATMRHYGAGLAIPDLPLSYGRLVPPTTWAALDAVQPPRWDGDKLASFTLGQVWLHYGHRVGAVLVSVMLCGLLAGVSRLRRGRRILIGQALALVGLLVVQITLGALTVLLRKPADVASAHVAVGALTLMTTAVLAARTIKLYWPTVEALDEARREMRPAFDVIPAATHLAQ